MLDEDERRQKCPLCDEDSCRHLVGERDPESMEWSGGLSDVPEVWALISQAELTARGAFFEPEADCHILKEIFADVPPWDKIEEDQAPEDFFREHHPRVDVCSVFWDGGSPGANGYVYYVYMTEEDQAQASKDLRRLQELIPNQLGLFEDAMSCREALRKSPRNERAWCNLACYCARLRRKDDCMFALKQAICLNHERGKMAAADINFDEFWNHRDFGKLVRRVKNLTPRDLEPGRGVALDLMSVARAAELERDQQKPAQHPRKPGLLTGFDARKYSEDMWYRKLYDMSPDEALFAAGWVWDVSEVATALDRGADPNARDSDIGNTAIMTVMQGEGIRRPTGWAAHPSARPRFNKQPNPDFAIRICTILLEHGADINARDDQGMTALDWAPSKSPQIAEFLKKRGALEGVGRDIVNAANAGDLVRLKSLIKGVELPRLPSSKSMCWDALYDLLTHAIHDDDIDFARLLLRLGVDVNKKVRCEDRSRLQMAVEKNSAGMVELLLKDGAGVNSETCLQSCLQLAIDEEFGEVEALLRGEGFGEVEALLRGAGVESTSSRPEELARGGGHGESVMTLDDVPVRLRQGWDEALPPATSKLPTDSKTMFLRGALTPAKRQLLHVRMADSRHAAYDNRKRIWDKAVDPANSQPADYVVRPAWTFKDFVKDWALVFVPLPGTDVLAALAGQKVGPITADAWRVRLIHSYTRFDQVRVGVSPVDGVPDGEVEARFLTFFRRGVPVAVLAPLRLGRDKDDGLEAHELKLRQQEA